MTLTVLQIIPALGTGGAEQAAVDIAIALQQRGDRPIVISTGGWRTQVLERAEIQHITYPVATKNPLKIIKNAFWLAQFIRKEKVDVVHSRSRAPAWSARIACALTACPYVTTFHAAYKFSNDIKKAYNKVMVSADRIIAISPFILHHIKKNYQYAYDKVRLVNRGVDIKIYHRDALEEKRTSYLQKHWKVEEGKPVLLFPARLSPIKGHMLIIEAIAILKKQGKTLPQVFFVGDDQGRESYSNSLQDLIEAEGLKDTIKLVGACSDMPTAYGLATLVLQPSQVPEGFGRVPIEAMAMEVPVLASNYGGMRYTIKDGKTGWLLDPKDKEVWAAAIDKALNLSEEERGAMGRKGQKFVARYFSKTAMVAQTLAVYDDVVDVGTELNV